MDNPQIIDDVIPAQKQHRLESGHSIVLRGLGDNFAFYLSFYHGKSTVLGHAFDELTLVSLFIIIIIIIIIIITIIRLLITKINIY